ncbi:monocarboxylate permease, putative [Talaromyces marneffei ATCC 18224]|uniref:Monocarboxylate permease, putative n=1 Tax=Talaromyces marneffei (strain ATCC 18224 / CBS 334.59 / QM 7333) TaxID=441960 RepID=B6QH35_TALMQ|nr:monocarboxylate permease, putative [Talaromyces marneffei ATCC 18224]
MDHTDLPQPTSTIDTHTQENHTKHTSQNIGTNSSTTSTMSHNDNAVFDEKLVESTSDGVLQTPDEGNNNKSDSEKPMESVHSVSLVPNGGTQAWLQVLAAHFLFFNSWGIVNTFGSYETYYSVDLLSTSSASAISWIGSVQAFLLLFVGALTGPLYDAGYARHLTISGSFFLVLGQMMLSLCKEYWQVLLAQGFCIGIGCGLLCVPSTAILAQYFSTKIATAVGFTAAGSSFGGIIYPVVFHKLQPSIGFPWATRVIGFVILATQLIAIAVYKVRILPEKKRAIIDFAAFKEPPYVIFVFSAFVGFMGLYQPFFYVQTFAIEKHITDANLGFYILAIMNATSAFGRIIPGILSDKIGPMNVIIPCAFISAMLCLCTIAVDNAAGLIVLMAFYGFFSGTFVSSPNAIVVHLSAQNRAKIGTRLGQMYGVISFAMLIGTPVGGVVLDNHGYTPLWIFSGVLVGVSGAFMILSLMLLLVL